MFQIAKEEYEQLRKALINEFYKELIRKIKKEYNKDIEVELEENNIIFKNKIVEEDFGKDSLLNDGKLIVQQPKAVIRRNEAKLMKDIDKLFKQAVVKIARSGEK